MRATCVLAALVLLTVGLPAWAQPPANDVCTDAIEIVCPPGGGSVTVSGSTTDATFDGAPFCGTSNTAPGVWYKVTHDGILTASTCNQATYDTKLSVYDGDCGGLGCVTGNDDTIGCGGLTTEVSWGADGTEDLILVHGFGAATGDFDLTITCSDRAENDFCEDAVGPLPVGSITSGSTTDASPDEPPSLDCGTSVTTSGVWYTVEGTGNTMTASTCNDGNPSTGSATYDSKISVYCEDCPDVTCVGGVDDSAGCAGFSTNFAWPTQPGATYRVLVHGFSSQTGDFDLAILDDGVPTDAAGTLCCPDDSAPIAWWKFDEGTGTDAFDSSGNDNDGELKSQPSAGGGASGAGVPVWTTGIVGEEDFALLFDGSNGYVDAGSDATLDNLKSFTYAAWVKRAANGDLEIFSKQNSYHELRFKGMGVLRGCVVGNLANACSDSVETVPLDDWTHVAMTYDHAGDRKVHLFIDGSEVTYASQTTAAGRLKTDASADQNLGRRNNRTRYYEGTLDEMLIFDRAVQDCKIRELALARSCGDCLVSNGTPGCEIAACEAEVCAIDPFCCDNFWDGICASRALDLCVPPDICEASSLTIAPQSLAPEPVSKDPNYTPKQ